MGFQYSLAERLSLGLTISQAFSPADRFESFLSTAALETRILLFGSAYASQRLVKLDGQEVAVGSQSVFASTQLILGFQQSFLNSEERTFAFSGPSVGVVCAASLSNSVAGALSGRAALLTNGVKSLTTYQVSATLSSIF